MEEVKSRIREWVRRVVSGEIPLHRIEEFVGNENVAVVVRRKAIEEITGVHLPAIGSSIIDFVEVTGYNIENPIGAVQIPLGVAGPLKVLGEYARGEYYIPLATTDGALVASVNRGCKALSLSGGVRTRILDDGMTRAPLFWTPDIGTALKLVEWVREHYSEIKEVAESTTRYGRLLEIKSFILGNNVWLRFKYSTGDAMGMNMATIATDKACKFIEENFYGEARLIALNGNMCVDKKPPLLNALFGRGKAVVAEAVVKRDVVEDVLKTTPEAIDEVNTRKNLFGSIRTGSTFYNAYYANILVAVFIATGQDPAQVVESSIGYTWTELRGEDLYISITLPSLEVGTVGGGTRLPTQREALALMGVAGSGEKPGVNAKKFAEIVAGAVLAGELNLLAVLASHKLASSHIMLGRGGLKSK